MIITVNILDLIVLGILGVALLICSIFIAATRIAEHHRKPDGRHDK